MNTADFAEALEKFADDSRNLAREIGDGEVAPNDIKARMSKLGAELEQLDTDARKL